MTGTDTGTATGPTVVLDTNALMMPVECDCRLFEGVERVIGTDAVDYAVPATVVAELDKLSEGNGAEATAARVGRDLADRCRVVETDETYADDAVVALADRAAADYVVTNDRPLRDRLSDREVRVIGLRGETKLAVTHA
ncbi:MAG: twitching motility protein PilT [Haloferacaceae archaeon]